MPTLARRLDGTHPEIVAEFAARAAAFLDRVPPGGFGTAGEEAVLARVAPRAGVEQRMEGRAVIDASGTYGTSNPLGVSGLPAVGEQDDLLGATGVWVLPNPSGLNAHWSRAAMVAEFARLRAAAG